MRARGRWCPRRSQAAARAATGRRECRKSSTRDARAPSPRTASSDAQTGPQLPDAAHQIERIEDYRFTLRLRELTNVQVCSSEQNSEYIILRSGRALRRPGRQPPRSLPEGSASHWRVRAPNALAAVYFHPVSSWPERTVFDSTSCPISKLKIIKFKSYSIKFGKIWTSPVFALILSDFLRVFFTLLQLIDYVLLNV